MTGFYPAHCGISEELEELLSFLMIVTHIYNLRVTDILMQPLFKEDGKVFSYSYEGPIPLGHIQKLL